MKVLRRLALAVTMLLGLASVAFFGGSKPTVNARADFKNAPLGVPAITFHYHRQDGNYASWDLWLWETGGSGVETEFDEIDSYGVAVTRPLSTWSNTESVWVIVRPGGWSQQTADMEVKFADFPADADQVHHVYLIDLESRLYATSEAALADKVLSAKFTTTKVVDFKTNHEPISATLNENGVPLDTTATIGTTAVDFVYSSKLTVNTTDFAPNFGKKYTVSVVFKVSGETVVANASFTGLFDDPAFVAGSTYEGHDLGVTYSPTGSTFKVWAPTSDEIELRIYEKGTPVAVDAVNGSDVYTATPMVKGDKGVWTATLTGDYDGRYYTYFVKNYANPSGVEVTDPYAKAAGINGDRGMILDFSKTNPTGWDQVSLPEVKPTELVVYELHVADLTSDTTWNGPADKAKKYLGLIQEGTTYTKDGVTVTTGFDHIKELGVNAVQILPFFDQNNNEVDVSFNWGYNPKNYDVLEGAYSADPYDGAVRVNEFKQVVQAYAKHDMRIIMDVVYNHVASVSAHSFTKLVPEYYFRYKADGSISNGSGVGNDTASERVMMERFMVDSTAWWAKEYKIAGFRFDLMGLHDVPTMNHVYENLQTIDSDIVVYGEPWKLSTVTTKQVDLATFDNISKTPGVGAFNDEFRDAVKGSVFDSYGKGWLQNDTPTVRQMTGVRAGMLGKYPGSFDNPAQNVNYVDCHDNNTIYDKLHMTTMGEFDEAQLLKRVTQSAALTLTAEGVSFIHAGAELLRSKPKDDGSGFDHNSYESSYEVNDIEWDRKITYADQYQVYKDLISLKVNNRMFQYSTRADVDAHVKYEVGNEFGFDNTVIRLTYTEGDEEFVVYHIGATTRVSIDLSGYEVVVDTSGVYETGAKLGDEKVFGNTSLILKKASSSNTSSSEGSTGSSSETITPPTGGMKGSEIALIVVGAVAVLAIAGGVVFLVIAKKKKI